MDDKLWQVAKARQGEISEKYATSNAATRAAHVNRLTSTHRPRYLLSGLLECGVCGGSCSKRGQDRYGCSSQVMSGACSNSRTIRRVEIEERVTAGLREKLMAPEAAAEVMKAYAEETNRLNRERRASGATDRKELADIGRKIATMLDVIEDGGCARGMMDRMREPEARQGQLNERLAAVPVDLPDIHPNIAMVYRRKVERPARTRRGSGRNPGADRAHRALPRREARRDGCRVPRRPRHHPRMGRQRQGEGDDRHSQLGNVGLGGSGGPLPGVGRIRCSQKQTIRRAGETIKPCNGCPVSLP